MCAFPNAPTVDSIFNFANTQRVALFVSLFVVSLLPFLLRLLRITRSSQVILGRLDVVVQSPT